MTENERLELAKLLFPNLEHDRNYYEKKYPERKYTFEYIFENFIGNGKPAYVPTYNFQTIDAINAILLDKDIKEYAQTIYDVASDKDIMVNAIYLASKIRQETGGNYTNSSIAGNPVTYNNKTYDAVYNPYNILQNPT